MKSFDTPILFLIFNRPETTKKVFDVIRKVKPSSLYIAADGPRPEVESDLIKCKAARNIIKEVDWECKIITHYRDLNLGCKYGVSEAITWFFDQVEEGIILEDDIIPDISFFDFCADLLNKYRTNHDIMHIAGFNICGKWKSNQQQYHFSYFGGIWGWATWRRSWHLYDREISAWANSDVQSYILNSYFPKELIEERKNLYDALYNNKINTWDYQWTFSKLLNKGLSIIPSVNLIQNIGFNSDATHSSKAPNWALQQVYKIGNASKNSINNESSISADKDYDNLHLSFSSSLSDTNSYFKQFKLYINRVLFKIIK